MGQNTTSLDAVIGLLHRADGMLTLMNRYRNAPVPEDARQDMLATGYECRAMAKRLEAEGVASLRGRSGATE